MNANTVAHFDALRNAYRTRDIGAFYAAYLAATADRGFEARVISSSNVIASIITIKRGGGYIDGDVLVQDALSAGYVAEAWKLAGNRLAWAKRTIGARAV